MTRRLLAGYLTLTLLVLVVLEVPLGLTFADNERDELRTRLERDAVVLTTLVEDALQHGGVIEVAPIRSFAADTGARVVVVDQRGIGLVDTDPPNDAERSFATRPEIIAALEGRVDSGTRRSETLDRELLYVAVPVASAGRVFGAVRVTYPTSEIDRRVVRYWLVLGSVAAVSLVAAAVLAVAVGRSVSRPLRRVQEAAVAIGGGDLGARAGPTEGPPVVRSLASVFDDMATRLQELVDAQDAFVADASHQLRTPLTALRLRLENLKAEVTPTTEEDLAGALDEVARLSRLVDGLLVLARPEREGAATEGHAIDVAAVVDERRQAWTALAEERQLVLRAERVAPTPALATPDRLRQVLDNLLANALDASPPGSTVTMRVEQERDVVAVHVIDEGPGLAAQDRAHAFDRFWRSSSASAGRLGGTGLGLAIVRKLVLADGGEVELREAPTGGVDAVVRLRAAEEVSLDPADPVRAG